MNILLNAVNIHCEPSRNITAYMAPVHLRQMILLLYILLNRVGFFALFYCEGSKASYALPPIGFFLTCFKLTTIVLCCFHYILWFA